MELLGTQCNNLSPSTMLSTALHGVIFLHHLYISLFILSLDYSKTDEPYLHDIVKKYQWRFLTGWNFTVALMFWPVYLYDRELVIPIVAEVLLPWWTNHSMHSVIVVALIIEMLISSHRYSKRSYGLAALATYVTIYNIVFFGTYLVEGVWLYPLPYVLNNFYRTLYFGGSNVAMFGFYMLGEYLSEKSRGEIQDRLISRGEDIRGGRGRSRLHNSLPATEEEEEEEEHAVGRLPRSSARPPSLCRSAPHHGHRLQQI
ncbi:hypothetical protein C0J52_04987 [Blattella germanica]|nr:hypothetical protein C0J52_04987 [Blattella germanica]